jgi:hypothetical protein
VGEDRGAGVAELVLCGGAVQAEPAAGVGVDGQGGFGFFDVAAGDVQDAVGLSSGPFQDEGGLENRNRARRPRPTISVSLISRLTTMGWTIRTRDSPAWGISSVPERRITSTGSPE